MLYLQKRRPLILFESRLVSVHECLISHDYECFRAYNILLQRSFFERDIVQLAVLRQLSWVVASIHIV